ncbi:MAG: mannose-1-phosphate guanylyltransferase/mannose-6-phosphate isomerase [Campylobacterales bacterium]
MTNVVLCGGSGTRLWPISRKLMPKQFVKLFDDKSLFQLTVERNSKVCDSQLIVSNIEQYFLAQDQLEELTISHSPLTTHYLLEPVGRNTAPAITLACMYMNPDEIVLVSPSDHIIKDEKSYSECVKRAKELADRDFLVTFGIKPNYPETGYGYIESEISSVKSEALSVKRFHEKPDVKTAEYYLQQNNNLNSEHSTLSAYYWNSGMFCFKAGVFLEEIKKHSFEIFESCQKAYQASKKDGMLRIKLEDMEKIPEDSIDYAVMERSSKVKMVASDIGWNDVGSFDAMYEEMEKDSDGNTKNSKHISIGSKNNLIIGEDREIATIDIEDMVIVDTGDALLLSKKGSTQKVKDVVGELKKRDTELHNIHLTAHRPWGTYTVLEDTPGYKIKRIVVKPKKRLSLQKHFHRNEHWIVVSGTATVTVGSETFFVRPNESTYIKMGEVHRLSNEGKIPLVLIEAQVGEYTGEDDIVRIDDDFKRMENE